MYSKKIQLRKDDNDLYQAIYRAMGLKAFERAKEKFGDKANRHIDSDGLQRRGYGKKWCGSYAYEFAKSIRGKNRASFDLLLEQYGFSSLKSFQRLPTQQSDERRAEQLFNLLADAQDISKAECLYEFLRFCKHRDYSLDVLKLESFSVDKSISSLKLHLEEQQKAIKAKEVPSRSETAFEIKTSTCGYIIEEVLNAENSRELLIHDFFDDINHQKSSHLLNWKFKLAPFRCFSR